MYKKKRLSELVRSPVKRVTRYVKACLNDSSLEKDLCRLFSIFFGSMYLC